MYLFTGRPGDKIFTRIKEKDIDSRFTKKQAQVKYADICAEIDKLSYTKGKHKLENSYGIGSIKRMKMKVLFS